MTMRAQLVAGIAALGMDFPADIEDQLLAYLALLEKWNRVHNLSHHLLDSLAVVPYFQAGRVLDVGSGGGLPGIPLAITRADLEVTLIDSIAKKTAFLLQAKAELGLGNVSVATGRVEAYQPEAGFNTITSRAFSDLKEFVTLTRHLLAPGGCWLAMKGLYPHEEIAALPGWVKLSADHVLNVPGLDASRHLIILEPVL